MNNDKLRGALALCRKAGQLKTGADAAQNAIARGAPLALFAKDAADRTKKNTLRLNDDLCTVELPFDQYELEQITGKRFVVAAVCDTHFKDLIDRAAKEESL